MKILISSKSFGKENTEAIKILKDAGLEPVMNPYNRALEPQEFSSLIRDAVGVIAGTEKIGKDLINEANLLRVISRFGVGTDNIDLEASGKRGIIVCSTPEAPTGAVAELALALILNLLRKIGDVDKNMHAGRWQPAMGSLLSGKMLGIIGLGRIGRELVRLTEPFGTRTIAHEPYPNLDFISLHGIDLLPIEMIMSESDIISLHLPLSGSTRHMIGERELSMMKPGSIIINTARGELIEEKALVNAIESGAIGGAALDVFEHEPYAGRLKEFNNVILTPHIGSYTWETRIRMEREAVENLISALRSKK